MCRDLQKLFGIRRDVVLKTDQEPAAVELVKQINALRPSSRWCLTRSGLGRSKGNVLHSHRKSDQGSQTDVRVPHQDLQERWFPGIWLDAHGGVVMKENSKNLTMEDYDKLISTPLDPTGTVKTATVSGNAVNFPFPDDADHGGICRGGSGHSPAHLGAREMSM